MAYIRNTHKDKGCPFCTMPRQKTPSEKNLVLWRDDRAAVIMNRFPYNPAHLLVIPRAHVAWPAELAPEDWQHVSDVLRACLDVLKNHHDPQGLNLGMNLGKAGGAGIPAHFHWHIVPRWPGDTNFFPLLAETKSIPVHNETIYRQLKPLFKGFEKRLGKAKLKKK